MVGFCGGVTRCQSHLVRWSLLVEVESAGMEVESAGMEVESAGMEAGGELVLFELAGRLHSTPG